MEHTTEAVVTIVIAVVVASLIEVLKYTNLRITEETTHVLALVLGIVGGFVAMQFTGGAFEVYVPVGIAGALAAPGVYDMLLSKVGLSKGVDK